MIEDHDAPRVPFVETSIALAINETIAFALSIHGTAVVVGRPGIGKTATLEHIARRDPRAVYVEYRARYRTTKGLHIAIMEADGWSHYHRTGFELEEACERCASAMAERGCFLLLDEYQNYDLEAIRSVLRFSDHFRLPIVFVGNEKRLRRVSADAGTYEQISDRIWKTVRLGDPVAEDFAAFAAACNIADKTTRDALVQLGLKTSLRHVTQVLQAALKIGGAEAPIELADLREAEGFLRSGTGRDGVLRLSPA
ncbi:AAA family ATPase [Lichenibacterium ramalinae]|uniref:ATP-binding protein n=1 Tax=Lichenibacterium ramalinae TaxID=2316527 RepID=A0A4Q2R8I1_9HYPH|nr:AAA family ATPase [Lichenibacterium ramalinae]RYB02039.1 ATP-binding protein [Lichenibacterium ramalinae]